MSFGIEPSGVPATPILAELGIKLGGIRLGGIRDGGEEGREWGEGGIRERGVGWMRESGWGGRSG